VCVCVVCVCVVDPWKCRFHVIIRLAAGCSKLHHLKNEDVI